MQERIIQLESKVCELEDALDAVNHTVFRQQQQIDLLTEQVRHLAQQVQSSAAAGGELRNLRDEIPPHY